MEFDEFSKKAQRIINHFEATLDGFEFRHKISFKDPPHDIARRFLNEIVEFKPMEEEEK